MIYEIEQQPKMKIEFQDYDDNTLHRMFLLVGTLKNKMELMNSDELICDKGTLAELSISITDLDFVSEIIYKLADEDTHFTIEGKFKNGIVISDEGD